MNSSVMCDEAGCFAGCFAVSFAGCFAGCFAGYFAGCFAGYFAGCFTGCFAGSFAGSFAGETYAKSDNLHIHTAFVPTEITSVFNYEYLCIERGLAL
jgi:hypothetical protein